MAKLNQKAFDLRSQLFSLVNEFKTLQQQALTEGSEAAFEASGQIDQTACALAEIYESLPDVFIDAARDTKDQGFAMALASR